MLKFFIKCANIALLVWIVIGVPAITHVQFRSYLIGSAPKLQLLLFWSLAVALGLNLLAGSFAIKNKKDRVLCWEWSAVFGVLLFAYCAHVFGYLNFDWLRNFLERL
jgi:hypothetical protein